MPDSPSQPELQAQVAELQQKLSRLEALVASLTPAALPAQQPATDSAKAPLSRRSLLVRLPAATAAVAGAAVVGQLAAASPAAADAGDPLVLGSDNRSDQPTTLFGDIRLSGEVLLGASRVNYGDEGVNVAYTHNQGLSVEQYEPYGDPEDGYPDLPGGFTYQLGREMEPYWVGGRFTLGAGGTQRPLVRVQGSTLSRGGGEGGFDALEATTVGYGSALVARIRDGKENGQPMFPGIGVEAVAADSSVALAATANRGAAITATTTSTTSTGDTVTITSKGLGRTLNVVAENPANPISALTGVSKGTGAGVWGHQTNPNATEAAVVGWSDTSNGRGGRFRGQAAQIRLTPGLAATHPTTGQGGDLYVDSTKRLWFCKGGTDWKQLA